MRRKRWTVGGAGALVLAAVCAMRAEAQWTAAGGPTEKASYVGVGTQPAAEALISQLNLTNGFGLVVTYVDPQSKAAGVLEVNDLLLRLADQLLVNQEQFAVLVRSRKPGEKVEIAGYRAGKRILLSLELSEKELPPLRRGSGMPFPFRFEGFPSAPDGSSNIFRNFRSPRTGTGGARMFFGPGGGISLSPGGGSSSIQVSTGSNGKHTIVQRHGGPGGMTGTFTTTEGDSTVTVEERDGDRRLRVTDADGKVVYEGAANTDDDRRKVPEQFRKSLEELDGMRDGMRIRLSDDRKPADDGWREAD